MLHFKAFHALETHKNNTFSSLFLVRASNNRFLSIFGVYSACLLHMCLSMATMESIQSEIQNFGFFHSPKISDVYITIKCRVLASLSWNCSIINDAVIITLLWHVRACLLFSGHSFLFPSTNGPQNRSRNLIRIEECG